MRPIEFETDLEGKSFLNIPQAIADQLPKKGHAKVILFFNDSDDAQWRSAAYEQFMRGDSPEDAVYDKYL
jgi:hypothetical protein